MLSLGWFIFVYSRMVTISVGLDLSLRLCGCRLVCVIVCLAWVGQVLSLEGHFFRCLFFV